MIKRIILAFTAFAATAAPAFAHLNPQEHGSFMAGLSHPLFGLDHILVMVAVGLWAAQIGGKALWGVPLAFVTTISLFVSGVVSPLLWPWFAAVLARDLATGALFAPATIFDGVVDTCALWLALAGPVAMVWPAALGMRRQKLTSYWPLLFLLPVWHVMLSVAAWRAVYDLWRNPFGWAKTTHGLALRRSSAD